MKARTRITHTALSVGDTVRVIPSHPMSVGRGTGVVTRLGDILAMVLFPQWDRPIACEIRDCVRITKGTV